MRPAGGGKRFGCMAIHNKALYKCIIHSFIHTGIPSLNNWRSVSSLIVHAMDPLSSKAWIVTLSFNNTYVYMTI